MSTTARRRSRALRSSDAPVRPARVSIVVAIYDPPTAALAEQLEAIARQTSGDWECIVVDDASTRPEIGRMLCAWVADGTNRRLITRAVNGGIAAATNDGLDAAIGEFVTICDHDDVLHDTAVESVIDHFDGHRDDDVVYSDEQVVDEHGMVVAEYRKPEYSPHRHLGHHYLAHLVAARRDAIGDLRVRALFEPSQDYDFFLRVIERSAGRGRGVGHIAEILYSWRAIAGSSALDAAEKPEMAAAVARCVQAALDRRCIAARAVTVVHDGRPTTSVRIESDAPTPSVTLVDLSATTTPADVNAAIAASGAVADSVICLTPDRERYGEDWASVLARSAVRPEVGVVGPRIVDASGSRLLSVGRVVEPALADPFAGVHSDASGPWGAFFVTREVSAVAPHGMVVAQSAFDSVDGLATDVGLDIAVAELGVRLAAVGRATLWHPGAEMSLGLDAGDPGGRLLSTDPDEMCVVAGDLVRATTRTDGLDHERFDLAGLSHRHLATPDPRLRARHLILGGRVDLVTSDVFDTLVTRHVATPSDVFVTLAERLDLPRHVSPLLFAEARRDAERRARGDRPAGPTPECTLAEIWQRMPDAWGDRDAMMQRELDIEAEVLRPIPEAVDVLRTAHGAGVPVVLVSDIYLSATELSDVLGRAGIEMGLVDAVVTSADHRLGKSDGLLAQVVDERGVDHDRVIHLGDNDISDVQTARRLGIEPVHVDVAGPLRHVAMPAPSLQAWSRQHGTDLGITAAVRSTLVAAGGLATDPSFQFGAATVGPVLTGFARWVSVTAADLGAHDVHCMLREGATIAELMAVSAPGGPVPRELHVSRWVTMRAAVVDGTVDELVTALARRSDLTPDHVVRAFGGDVSRVRGVLGTDVVRPGDLVEACQRLVDDDEIRTQCLAASAALRARVSKYLATHLVVDPDAPIVVADVGWGGTIQEGLTRILRAGGIANEVVGLYLALSAPGEQRLSRGQRMLSYLPNESDDPAAARDSRAVAHHADTIERVMTPEIGTLVDIDDAGEPVCRPASDDVIPPTLAAAQRALRAVADHLSDPASDIDDPAWTSDGALRAAFARTLADAIMRPSRPLAEALGAWPHDDVAGTAHRSIAGAELATAVRFANARDVDLLDPTGRSWVAGLAGAHNPQLSAQLAAAQLGIGLDVLVPESENGVARLAVFEIDSDMAALQVGRTPGVTSGGWSVLRLVGEVGSLRSVRFDAGEHDALVDVGHLSVRLTTVGGAETLRDVRLDDDDLIWVAGRPLDRQRFVQRAGGHLLIDLDQELASDVRHVEVTAAFRSWLLGDDDSLLTAPIRQRLTAGGRRVGASVRRRLS